MALKDERLQRLLTQIDSSGSREKVGLGPGGAPERLCGLRAGHGAPAALLGRVEHGEGSLRSGTPPARSCGAEAPSVSLCPQALEAALQGPAFQEVSDKVRACWPTRDGESRCRLAMSTRDVDSRCRQGNPEQ